MLLRILPEVKQGEVARASLVLKNLGISTKQTKATYMVAQTLENEVKLMASKIEDDLQSERMPDLSGINLEDVLYLLERYGIKVKISGSGGVVKQSIEKGEQVRRGNVIKLELA